MNATRTAKAEVLVGLKDRMTRSPAIYVTDAEMANPRDRLPSHWDDEVAALPEILAQKK